MRKHVHSTDSKTRPIISTSVNKVQRLFDPPQLLDGEDSVAYSELLNRVTAAVKPIDIIDEIFIDDLVSLEWEVLRWRRLKLNLIRTLELEALKYFLFANLDYEQYRKYFAEDLTEILQDNLAEDQTEDEARKLAQKCAWDDPDADDQVNQFLDRIDLDMDSILNSAKTRKAEDLTQEYAQRKPGAIRLINKLLARANSSIEALIVRELAEKLDSIERIDRLTSVAENRRNAMLREIARRRAVLGEALRRNVQEVEGEFEVIDKTPETKSENDQRA